MGECPYDSGDPGSTQLALTGTLSVWRRAQQGSLPERENGV
jgi:hypothetical protein